MLEDWIGIYRKGETDDSKYLDWRWVDGTKTNSPKAVKTNGQINIPNAFTQNDYEIRYFTKDNSLTYPWRKLESKVVDASFPSSTPVPPTIKPPLPSNTSTPPSITPLLNPSITPTSLSGDLNNDRRVDIFDFNILITNFGKIGTNQADIDGNGKVDIFDFNILITNFGKTQ